MLRFLFTTFCVLFLLCSVGVISLVLVLRYSFENHTIGRHLCKILGIFVIFSKDAAQKTGEERIQCEKIPWGVQKGRLRHDFVVCDMLTNTPTTLVVLYKSTTQLTHDHLARQGKCGRILKRFKTLRQSYVARGNAKWCQLYTVLACMTEAVRPTKVACNSRWQKL